MNNKKKVIITFIVTILITLIFRIIKNLILGTDTIYIADYMPSPDIDFVLPFPVLAIKHTIINSLGFIIFNFAFSILYHKVMVRKFIFDNYEDRGYSFIVFLIPVITVMASIYLQLGFTA